MSVRSPSTPSLQTTSPTSAQDCAELERLRDEIEALTAENAHLRQALAPKQPTSTGPAEVLLSQGLPTHFDWTDESVESKAAYGDLVAALSSVFPIGILRTDAAGLITAVDSNLQRIFGLKPSEFANFGWVAVVHPEDQQRARDRWQACVVQPQGQSTELRLLRADGQIRHVLVRNTPRLDEDGQLEGQLGFVQDITELRELGSDDSLKEELNRQIIASSPDCTKVLDLQGRVLQMTAQGFRLVEVDDFEEVRHSDWCTWWPNEGEALARAALDGASRSETTRFVAFGPTLTGTPKWWDTVINPICNASGQPVMLLAVSRDISEGHKQQEEIQALYDSLEAKVELRTQELAQANQRIRQALNEAQALYNQAPCGYHSLDADGVYLRINQTELDWLGYRAEEVVGTLGFVDLVAPASQAQVQSHLERLQRGETLEPTEIELVRRDGSRLMVLLSSTATYDAQGRLTHTNDTVVDITQRKAAEGRVREVNGQLNRALEQAQAVYNQAPCGYHSVDASGRYVSINDTELNWLGYQRHEVVGKKSLKDFVSPQRARLMDERLHLLIEQGHLEGAEYELYRRDGSSFHALVSSSAVRDANGRFLHSNTTVVDISARKVIELALRANQRLIKAITDHVPGLISYLDTDLRFRFANAKHLSIYGMDPNVVLGKPLKECVSPDVWNEVSPILTRALAGETQRFEAWRETVQGQPMFVSGTFLPDLHDGEVKGIFIQMIDITDRKRVEERVSDINAELELRVRERSVELLESEQRFRLMVDNMRDYSVFFLDSNGCISDWTDSAQRMDGFSSSEMLGQHYGALLELTEGDNARELAEKLLRLAASRGQHEVNTWQQRKDGSTYWAHSLLIALRDDGEELRGFAKISHNMTEAKRLDDLMRNINDELETRVAERTEQLLTANKDLESFSYSVSHDLRSPLRHISSFVALLQEHLGDRCDEASARYLGTIANSARHMSQLIDGLLAFSRLGRAAVNIAPVDTGQLVNAVVAQLSHDTEGRTVDWVAASDLPVIQGDALLLREVWANLLGNAYKYTRPRERARVEVGWTMDPSVGYTFYVRDNGVGFDPKYSNRLFGVFQRLHRATEFEGTGIGLALARRIIERHGGSIWAESQLGEGSVFSFSLPFENPHAAESSRESIYGALSL